MVPLLPGLYKIVDARMPQHNVICDHWTIQQHNNTGTHSTSLWLAFLASVQQGRALEHTFIVLNSMSTHCHGYRKYTRSLWNTNTSIFRTCSGGSYMVSALKWFHCMPVTSWFHISYVWLRYLPCPTGNSVGWYSTNIHHQTGGTVLHELFPLLVRLPFLSNIRKILL